LLSDSPERSTYHNGNCRTYVQLHIPLLWHSRRHHFRQRTTIHLSCLEGFPFPPGCDRQPVIRISSSVERADGKEDPGDHPLPVYLLSRPPGFLEPVLGLGRVRTELPPTTIYRTHSIPVRTLLPTPTVPLGRGTLQRSCSRLLVPGEREGLGLSPPPTAASPAQTQNDSRPSSFRSSLLSTGTEGLAVNPGHQTASALQEAESQIHWPIHHHQTDQPSHIPTPTPSTVQNSSYIPCVTPQTSPPFCSSLHRT
ncbi:hypothetical protein ABG768_021348, partial [Culter alburnus]